MSGPLRMKLGLAPLSVFALSASLLLGCDPPKAETKPEPWLVPRTTAPPGAITEYVEDRTKERRSIRVTEGVAMALECRDSKGAPCLLEGSASASDDIATVRRAYGDLDQTVASGHRSSQVAYLNRTLFVVVARRAGNTTLTVHTGLETMTVDVQVFPPK